MITRFGEQPRVEEVKKRQGQVMYGSDGSENLPGRGRMGTWRKTVIPGHSLEEA